MARSYGQVQQRRILGNARKSDPANQNRIGVVREDNDVTLLQHKSNLSLVPADAVIRTGQTFNKLIGIKDP